MRTAILITVAVAWAAASAPDIASAASCREQLADFERRLYESSLAADDPEAYADLAREVEEISELRDEALCAERLAELNDELPEPEANSARASGTRG
ncbi:MAG TPA: hypothetical protein VFG91_04575 [Woeseiaceae bacterium]|nr:hypothetical protein [Woeseiaceae bacterium]